MTVRDAALGPQDDDLVRIAAAIRAVDAAMAACEAARLALIAVRGGSAPVPQESASDGCSHPVSERQRFMTFGGSAQVFCGLCGERADI